MNNSADTINAILGQRDSLATMIEASADGDELAKAESMVRFVADLWLSLGYGYKVDEMRARVVRKAKQLKADEEYYLAKCRKNDKTRSSTLININRLEKLASL